MNLALEQGERVTTVGKGRGEIGSEAGEVTGVVGNAKHNLVLFLQNFKFCIDNSVFIT